MFKTSPRFSGFLHDEFCHASVCVLYFGFRIVILLLKVPQAFFSIGILFFSETGSLLQSLVEGNVEEVLLSPQVLDLLAGDGSCSEEEDVESYLERRLLLYLADGSIDTRTNR